MAHKNTVNENKKIIRNSGLLYIKFIVSTLFSLVTSRLVFQSLGASDYGLYNVVGGLVVIINIFNTAMVSTTYRFVAFEMGKNDLNAVRRIFNISLVLHTILAFAIIILAETIGKFYIRYYLNVPLNSINEAIFVFDTSVIATFFSIFSIPFQALIVAHEKFTIQITIEIISNILRLCIATIIFYYIGNKLHLYAVLIAIVTTLPTVIYLFYCRKKYAYITSWHFERDKRLYKEMISYSGWIFLGACSCISKIQGSAIFINLFFGTVINASFAIANQVNNLVLMFAQNLVQAAIPQITKSFSSGYSERMTQLSCYISKYSFFLMLLPALPILLETNFILTLWMGKVPTETVLLCQLMILNALIDAMSSGLPAVVQATGKIKYFQIFSSFITLSSLPIAYILFINNYPAFSIIIIYIITAFINLLVAQILLKKIINFDIIFLIKKVYIRIILVSLFLMPLFYIKSLFIDDCNRFIFLSLLSLFWTLFVIYFIGIDNKERNLIKTTCNSFIRKKTTLC